MCLIAPIGLDRLMIIAKHYETIQKQKSLNHKKQHLLANGTLGYNYDDKIASKLTEHFPQGEISGTW